jgi:hypothetical protein
MFSIGFGVEYGRKLEVVTGWWCTADEVVVGGYSAKCRLLWCGEFCVVFGVHHVNDT